ncbi:MAG: hypothetical protein OIF57_18250 [Marinobacterium sp.]|nr:hypothetical protein [Marinobacterium sp.]
MNALQLAAGLNFIGAALHLVVIWWGPEGYRFFGAGEKMAQMAERKSPWPATLTLLITAILTVWGLYCLALNNNFPALPWMNIVVPAITGIYLLRAAYPLLLSPWVAFFRTPFMVWSSLICGVFGAVHLAAIWPLLFT